MGQFLNDKEDCKWLRETALRGYEDIPAFQSFVIEGHEDCPLVITLYASFDPLVDEPGIVYQLTINPFSNLSHYERQS